MIGLALTWLKALSPRVWAEIALSMALVAGAVWAGHAIDAHNKRVRQEGVVAGRAEVQQKWDAAERVRAETAAKAEAEEREKEARRSAADVENRLEAQRLATRSLDDHAAAAAERQRLLNAAELAAARAGGGEGRSDPAASTGSASAEALRDVLGRCTSRLVELAAAADEARNAGLTCERAYDSLMP